MCIRDSAVDATSTATPLGILKEGGGDLPSNLHMFLGFIGGSMGEVSAIALLVGGLFLIWKKIISPIIPVSFIGSVFVFAAIYYGVTGTGDALDMAVFHVPVSYTHLAETAKELLYDHDTDKAT